VCPIIFDYLIPRGEEEKDGVCVKKREKRRKGRVCGLLLRNVCERETEGVREIESKKGKERHL
jgi:hypothetical protein